MCKLKPCRFACLYNTAQIVVLALVVSHKAHTSRVSLHLPYVSQGSTLQSCEFMARVYMLAFLKGMEGSE